MRNLTIGGEDFCALSAQILGCGESLLFQARGSSMLPFLRGGDRLLVRPGLEIRRGDVVLCRTGGGRMLAHRAVRVCRESERTLVSVQGDAWRYPDGLVLLDDVMGRVVALEREGRRVTLDAGVQRLLGLLWVVLSPLSHGICSVLLTLVRKVRRRRLVRNGDPPEAH